LLLFYVLNFKFVVFWYDVIINWIFIHNIITFSLKLYVVVLYFFYRNTCAITRYDFRYNFIKVFGVADIFRYPISRTLCVITLLIGLNSRAYTFFWSLHMLIDYIFVFIYLNLYTHLHSRPLCDNFRLKLIKIGYCSPNTSHVGHG